MRNNIALCDKHSVYKALNGAYKSLLHAFYEYDNEV